MSLPRTPAAARAELERRARAEAARVWLIGEGHLEPVGPDEYRLSDAGRDWLIWALWQAAGYPGVPRSAFEKEA